MKNKTLNGWQVEKFQSTVDAVKGNPESGKLAFRTRTVWDAGFAVDGKTEGIEQAGNAIRRRFTLRGDHPPELLGENTGPTAVETLLAGLGSCIAGTYAAHATARGVKLDALEVDVEGTVDLNGFLQLQETRAGLSSVNVKIRVKSDADESALRDIADVVKKASPVYDSVANPVAVRSAVERMKL